MFWPFGKKKNWGKLGIEMSRNMVRQILLNAGITDIRLSDTKYRAIPYEDFAKLAWAGKDTFEEYEKEIADCDDQALFYESDTRKQWAKKAKGSECALAFGQAKVLMPDGKVPHAIVWQLDDRGLINWVEPQTHQRTKEPATIYWVEG